MELNALTAISPIDGRYRSKTTQLADYFSEYALIRYRVRVEIEYFIALCELPLPQLENFNHDLFEPLRDIYRHFTEQDAARIKDIEKVPLKYFIVDPELPLEVYFGLDNSGRPTLLIEDIIMINKQIIIL